jgi:hypothetical protein
MADVSTGLLQLGFGSIGVLLMVSAGCLSALAVARTKKALRELR